MSAKGIAAWSCANPWKNGWGGRLTPDRPRRPLKMNTIRFFFALAPLIAGFCLFSPKPLFAHGALMEYAFTKGITIQAKYDTGHPMPEAKITVYAPDNPAKPWLRGVSDKEGRFGFIPNQDMPGTWTIQARQAGHGAMIHIQVDRLDWASDPDSVPAPVSGGPNTSQRLLMALAVIWGFVGTALYFSRKRIPPGTAPRTS